MRIRIVQLEENKAAQLTVLPEDYDLIEEVKEDDFAEKFNQDSFEDSNSRTFDSETIDDEAAEQHRLRTLLLR